MSKCHIVGNYMSRLNYQHTHNNQFSSLQQGSHDNLEKQTPQKYREPTTLENSRPVLMSLFVRTNGK